MKFRDKYIHVGYSNPSVPDGWVKIVEKAIIEIEKEMWPRWIPKFIKRKIHYLATGNKIHLVRSHFWNKVRSYLTNGQMITDVKDKYASLRIYGYFGESIEKIIDDADTECTITCEKCGSQDGVRTVGHGWIYNLCKSCRRRKKLKKTEPLK